jgi:N-acetylglucosamine-6-phosphate deacetylase
MDTNDAPPATAEAPRGPWAARGQLLIDGRLAPGAVVVDGGAIAQVILDGDSDGARALPARVIDAAVVTPGLIDLQCNGGFGLDAGGGAGALAALAARLPATGVTAFLPTLVSGDAATYAAAADALDGARGAPGAAALGLHMEGPLLAEARAGAHRREIIAAASGNVFDGPLARGALRLVTLAPERPGALALIRRLRARGVAVSLGHTDAGYEDFIAAADAGATMATHLYNAMSPLAHRAPGAVGAALTDDRIVAGLIADGVHVHPAALSLALRAKGPDRLALVTDATMAAGLGPGRHQLGGRTIVSDGTSVRLEDGTLAGSALTLDQAVRNFVRFTGAPPAAALLMATAVPARILDLPSKGRLAAGCDADLVLWSDDLRVAATYVGGRRMARGK